MNDTKRWLRPNKAADKLGISTATLWRWVHQKPTFPKPVKLGVRTTVFSEGALDQFIAAAPFVTGTPIVVEKLAPAPVKRGPGRPRKAPAQATA